MKYILNIDTSLPRAVVFISANGIIVQTASNENQRDHASFLHPAIKQLLEKEKIKMSDLSAVSVAIGPGSYTGIRVGMATAKGLCLALNIPIIPIDNLYLLAAACNNQIKDGIHFICSMIDARRMEVFSATYNLDLNIISGPCVLILNENSFSKRILNKEIVFCGNGAEKFIKLLSLDESFLINIDDTSEVMSEFTYKLLSSNSLGSLINVQPFYMKDFYNG